MARQGLPHSSHWGAFSVVLREDGIEVVPHPRDPDPSALLGNIPASVSHPARIARPMVRRGWLERGPGPDPRRGRDELLPVSWPRALDLVAAELRRVYAGHGPRAIFGGSYGWASAGRFHDAQSQIHRFLNFAGGYVRSVGSYSSGAATIILPYVIGPQAAVAGNNVSWAELVAESALVLAFGGMALKNNDVGGGGTSIHIAREQLRAARDRGVEFHLIGPLCDDLPAEIGAVWHPIRPGTDVALMLGIAHTLVTEGRHDRAFLDRFCVGWEVFEGYLLGGRDAQPKNAAWAADICGLPASRIISLARRAASAPPWSPARNHCSAPSMASSRCGWGWCWRHCSGRSGCRAAVSPMPWGRPRTPESLRWPCRSRRCRKAAIASATLSRWRGWPTCCCTRASHSNSTVNSLPIPTSGWSIGPVATRSTTTRI
jgi:biotin/methionine sulfoxide reductase